MSELPSADGLSAHSSTRAHEPDAHGQAALMLAESTLHTLIEAHIITRAQAIETLEVAAEVKEEIAWDAGESQARMQQSLQLLRRIGLSLATIEAPNDHD